MGQCPGTAARRSRRCCPSPSDGTRACPTRRAPSLGRGRGASEASPAPAPCPPLWPAALRGVYGGLVHGVVTHQDVAATCCPRQQPKLAAAPTGGCHPPAPSSRLGGLAAAAPSGWMSCCGNHGVCDAGAATSPGSPPDAILPLRRRARGLLPGQGPPPCSGQRYLSGHPPKPLVQPVTNAHQCPWGHGEIHCQVRYSTSRHLFPSHAPLRISAQGLPQPPFPLAVHFVSRD